MDKYAALNKFSKLTPSYTTQLNILNDLLHVEADMLTWQHTAYWYMLDVALVKIPKKINGSFPKTLNFTNVKYNGVQARDKILSGNWAQIYDEAEEWYQHAAANGLLKKRATM